MGTFLTPLERQVLRYTTVRRRSPARTASPPQVHEDVDRSGSAIGAQKHAVAGVNKWLEKARRHSWSAHPRGI